MSYRLPPTECSVPDQSQPAAKKATIAKTWIKLAFTFMSAIISLNNSYKHSASRQTISPTSSLEHPSNLRMLARVVIIDAMRGIARDFPRKKLIFPQECQTESQLLCILHSLLFR